MSRISRTKFVIHQRDCIKLRINQTSVRLHTIENQSNNKDILAVTTRLGECNQRWNNRFGELAKEVILKASLTDVLSLVEERISSNHLESRLAPLENEISDTKVVKKEMIELRSQIERSDCSGRWIWNSGNLLESKTRGGPRRIPWEFQIKNTHFRLSQNMSEILISEGGFYQLILGIWDLGVLNVI
eukprot:GHVL01019563.1.p1 GENE.GHVL01019563.1~~GHVL01019563.1.p1  ORF type:complete len:187 (-),score=21.44 GHVL01019563.1:66-626(-)